MALEPTQKLDAIVDEMNSIYNGEFNRQPDYNNPRDCALAISRWLADKHPGKFVGGFFDGEQARNAEGQLIWGVIAVGRSPQ